jgi:gamma-glutamyltranspeptidase/glutathione hydrolase
MVATSQPLAAQAGLRLLAEGGSASDAAVAAAAMLAVVEPTGTGLGGDCFVLHYEAASRSVRALNGSGRSAGGATAETLRGLGLSRMPERGALAVTVPGAVRAWDDLLAAHGRLGLARALAPAIATAEAGYPVSELVARAWQASAGLLGADPGGRRHFLPDGRPPGAGQLVRLPALARTLAELARQGADALYHGRIAADIVASCRRAGGLLTEADLARHRSSWVTPLAVGYRDLRIWQCPPNGQGLAVLVALAIADGWEPPSGWGDAVAFSRLVAAMRLGREAAAAWVADPEQATLPIDEILSPEAIARQRAAVGPDGRLTRRAPPIAAGSDTVVVTAVDAEGNGCALINSNYMGFGSGLVAEASGIPLQNRGAGFTLEPGHPNEYAPGKRPFHTLIPGLATRSADDALFAVFGVMGGPMQPQGHLQVVVNLADRQMDPQRALDAPRFQILADGALALEPGLPLALHAELAALGHRLVPAAARPPAGHFGGGQLIVVAPSGVRLGGSDPRKDGQAVALP